MYGCVCTFMAVEVVICYFCIIIALSPEHRERMKREYLSDPQFNFETVNHASRACGPLVKWAIAQVQRKHVI